MTEQMEQMIFNEGYRRGKEEEHKWWSFHCAKCTDADRPKGEWIDTEVFNENNDDHYVSEWQSARCSNCGKYHTTPYRYYFDNFNFCPNCGCDMRGEDNE